MTKEINKRKEYPIYSGVIKYFPDALMEVSNVSYVGNKQHNEGDDLYWDRDKSSDDLDAAMRHLADHARGEVFDSDGLRHISKTLWRLCAYVQKTMEVERDGRD